MTIPKGAIDAGKAWTVTATSVRATARAFKPLRDRVECGAVELAYYIAKWSRCNNQTAGKDHEA